jgi:hypothetical protein
MTYNKIFSIMTALMVLMNTLVAASAFMRGSNPSNGLKTTTSRVSTMVGGVAGGSGRRQLVLSNEDMMKRLVHDANLLSGASARMTSAAIATRSSGRLVSETEQMTDCQEIQAAAYQTDVTNPFVFTDDTTGLDSYIISVFDPTSTGTEVSVIGFFLDAPNYNTTIDGVCYKMGVWSFDEWPEEDAILITAPCDGSGFPDQAFDQLIFSGAGNYECAMGYVDFVGGKKRAGVDIVTFDLAFCQDLSNCTIGQAPSNAPIR